MKTSEYAPHQNAASYEYDAANPANSLKAAASIHALHSSSLSNSSLNFDFEKHQQQVALAKSRSRAFFAQIERQEQRYQNSDMERATLDIAQRSNIVATSAEEHFLECVNQGTEIGVLPDDLALGTVSDTGLLKLIAAMTDTGNPLQSKVKAAASSELERREMALMDVNEEFGPEDFKTETVDLRLSTLRQPLLDGLPLDSAKEWQRTIREGRVEERILERQQEAVHLKEQEFRQGYGA